MGKACCPAKLTILVNDEFSDGGGQGVAQCAKNTPEEATRFICFILPSNVQQPCDLAALHRLLVSDATIAVQQTLTSRESCFSTADHPPNPHPIGRKVLYRIVPLTPRSRTAFAIDKVQAGPAC